MTEMECREALVALYNQDEVYILLSAQAANLLTGESVPYIGKNAYGDRVLAAFTSIEKARDYIDQADYEKPAGNYLIGKLGKNDTQSNFKAVLSTALELGVESVDFDLFSGSPFGCRIEYFLDLVGVEKEERLGVSKQFSMIPIIAYKDPYRIPAARAEVILKQVFNGGKTFEEFKATFVENQNLNENCFVADVLNRRMIPQAKQNGRDNDVEYFRRVNALLEMVVWEKLATEKELYILTQKDTKKVFLANGAMYVLFTDYYKNMSEFNYKKVSGRDEIEVLIAANDVQGLIVTDGPGKMIIVDKPVFIKK